METTITHEYDCVAGTFSAPCVCDYTGRVTYRVGTTTWTAKGGTIRCRICGDWGRADSGACAWCGCTTPNR